MSKYLVGIAMAFIVSVTHAQQMNIPSFCVSFEQLQDGLTEWNELPVALGQSVRNTDNGVIKSTLIVYINSKTGTWTIVEELFKGKFCIVAMGEEFSPVPKDVVDQEKRRQEGL